MDGASSETERFLTPRRQANRKRLLAHWKPRLERALARHEGNRKRAAKALGITKVYLHQLLRGPFAELAKKHPPRRGRPRNPSSDN